MRIMIGGASGMIGKELIRRLRASGHDVTRLVRRSPRNGQEVQWDPNRGQLDPRSLENFDAVINLSGAGIGNRPWTRSYVEQLYSSRINATRTLTAAMVALPAPPAVFVSQSASGYYGDRREETLSENSDSGRNLLADICRKWEAAAAEAPAQTRTVITRTGVVMSPYGGALARLLVPLRLGAGGTLGTGNQWWPWISLNDEARAIEFLLSSGISGAVNLCAPEPAQVSELIAALATVLGKPARLRVPEAILTAGLGELAKELLLASARMQPRVLAAAGFTFEQPTVESLSQWVKSQIA